jgi:hypothetical protein
LPIESNFWRRKVEMAEGFGACRWNLWNGVGFWAKTLKWPRILMVFKRQEREAERKGIWKKLSGKCEKPASFRRESRTEWKGLRPEVFGPGIFLKDFFILNKVKQTWTEVEQSVAAAEYSTEEHGDNEDAQSRWSEVPQGGTAKGLLCRAYTILPFYFFPAGKSESVLPSGTDSGFRAVRLEYSASLWRQSKRGAWSLRRSWTDEVDFGDEGFEVDGVAGFEGGAMFGADGLAFVGEFDALLAGVAEDGDEAAGPGEEAINGPRSKDLAFADLAGPVDDGDAGGVVLEDWDLVGAELNWHAVRMGANSAGWQSWDADSATNNGETIGIQSSGGLSLRTKAKLSRQLCRAHQKRNPTLTNKIQKDYHRKEQ